MNSPASPPSSLSDWLARLGVTGVGPAYLLAAITHPSYRSLDPATESYERLEFLGDAVINLVVAEILFRAMPSVPEGILTERRAALVKRDTLAGLYDHFGLGAFLRASPGYVPSLKDKSNVVEALFGAVLVGGRDFAACHTLWLALSKALPPAPGIDAPRPAPDASSPTQARYQAIYQSLGIPQTTPQNAKNALQQLCQKQGLPIPAYMEVARTGPEHRRIFHVRLVLRPFTRDSTATFESVGEGMTLAAAEMQAATRMCDLLSLPYTPQ